MRGGGGSADPPPPPLGVFPPSYRTMPTASGIGTFFISILSLKQNKAKIVDGFLISRIRKHSKYTPKDTQKKKINKCKLLQPRGKDASRFTGHIGNISLHRNIGGSKNLGMSGISVGPQKASKWTLV